MCIEIGVDPLASISLQSKELNLAEFYYTFSNSNNNNINDKRSFNRNKSIKKYVKKTYESRSKKKDITIEDIELAIKSVSELQYGFQIFEINNSKAVVTIPMEKPVSVDKIIKLASENNEWIGYSICFNKANMEKIEFENAI